MLAHESTAIVGTYGAIVNEVLWSICSVEPLSDLRGDAKVAALPMPVCFLDPDVFLLSPDFATAIESPLKIE